jgi:hypothetical protein
MANSRAAQVKSMRPYFKTKKTKQNKNPQKGWRYDLKGSALA